MTLPPPSELAVQACAALDDPRPVHMARLLAIIGKMPWQPDTLPEHPCLADVARFGYVGIWFAGDRAPRFGLCCGCQGRTTYAFTLQPLGFTVPGCSAECVSNAISTLWKGPQE